MADNQKPDTPGHDITVVINERPVVFNQHKATGAEIKVTAIAQGVQIKPDFSLYEVVGGKHLKPVGDAETVTLHEKQVFRATAPDDVS